MKVYTKLPIPKDSAWERKTWRRYVHLRILEVVDGIHNILRWIPTLYRDRGWDDYYITKILQKKIEFQRKYLVNKNRHTEIDRDNRYMTVALNLIERVQEEYYCMEKYDYEKSNFRFEKVEDMPGYSSIHVDVEWEDYDSYLLKYKGAARRVMKKYSGKDLTNKEDLAFYVGIFNQERCNRLLWKVMEEKSQCWWD